MAFSTRYSAVASAILSAAMLSGGNAYAAPAAGDDPYWSGCGASAYIFRTEYVQQFKLESWYSPACNMRYVTLNLQVYPNNYPTPNLVDIFVVGNFGNGGFRRWIWAGPGWYYGGLMPNNSFWAPCANIRYPNGGVVSNCTQIVVVK